MEHLASPIQFQSALKPSECIEHICKRGYDILLESLIRTVCCVWLEHAPRGQRLSDAQTVPIENMCARNTWSE